MSQNRKNIIFDLGNVLIDIDEMLTFDRLYRLVSEHSDPQTAQKEITKASHQFERGEIGNPQFLNALLRWMPAHIQARELIDIWNGMLQSIPQHRLQAIQKLSLYHTTLVLSNTNPIHMDWVQQYQQQKGRPPLPSFFHHFHLSYHLKSRKPETDIFQMVLEQHQLLPGDTLFFDDKTENIEAARQLGIQAILSPPETEITEQLRKLFPNIF